MDQSELMIDAYRKGWKAGVVRGLTVAAWVVGAGLMLVTLTSCAHPPVHPRPRIHGGLDGRARRA